MGPRRVNNGWFTPEPRVPDVRNEPDGSWAGLNCMSIDEAVRVEKWLDGTVLHARMARLP